MTIEQTDDTKTLTEDEQFAQLTAGNPLFDEAAPGERSAQADQQQGGADEAAKDKGAETTARVDAGDGEQKQDADTADQTAAAPGDAADGGGKAADEPFPGYATLTPEAREAFDKLANERRKYENDYRALHGMTAPLQRGNEELRRQLQAQVARIQQLEQLGRKQQDVSAAKDEAFQEFDQWAQQYPEESKALLALVNPLREKVTALEGSLGAAQAELGHLHAERQQAALAREVGELEKSHPDWRSIHESQDYWDWLNAQPPGIQGLNSSMYAGDTIQLLNLFKGTRAPAPTPAPASQQAVPTAADNVQQRRNQSLKQGTQPAVRSSESSARQGGNQGDMSDEDAQFAALVADNPNFR